MIGYRSYLTHKIKRIFFQVVVVSIRLYGCTRWTITKRMDKKLNGNYTRMLQAALNKSCRQQPIKHQLYGHLPHITKTMQVRWTRQARYCWRIKNEIISDILLWTPSHGRPKIGRPARTYVLHICADTGCSLEDVPGVMDFRDGWQERVSQIRSSSATWWCWYSNPEITRCRTSSF